MFVGNVYVDSGLTCYPYWTRFRPIHFWFKKWWFFPNMRIFFLTLPLAGHFPYKTHTRSWGPTCVWYHRKSYFRVFGTNLKHFWCLWVIKIIFLWSQTHVRPQEPVCVLHGKWPARGRVKNKNSQLSEKKGGHHLAIFTYLAWFF